MKETDYSFRPYKSMESSSEPQEKYWATGTRNSVAPSIAEYPTRTFEFLDLLCIYVSQVGFATQDNLQISLDIASGGFKEWKGRFGGGFNDLVTNVDTENVVVL